MKRIIITTALLLGTVIAAQAQTAPAAMYKDLIRPNGQKRSAAVYQADLDACYAQTGQSRYEYDGPAFKKCMLSRGYQFMWQHRVATGSGHAAPSTAGLHKCGPGWYSNGNCHSWALDPNTGMWYQY